MAKKESLTKKTLDELTASLQDAYKELKELSFMLSSSVRDVKKKRDLKKMIARLKGELHLRNRNS